MEERHSKKRKLDDTPGTSGPDTAEEVDKTAQNAEDNMDGRDSNQKTKDTEKIEFIGKETEDNDKARDKDVEEEATFKFTDLPELALRKILKMLKDDQRAIFELRQVSKSVKQIVDSHADLCVNVDPYNHSEAETILEKSELDIHVDLVDFEEDEIIEMKDFLIKFSHRIISITGSAWGIAWCMQEAMPNLEKIICSRGDHDLQFRRFKKYFCLPPELNKLKHMELIDVKLATSNTCMMPNLQTLVLHHVNFVDNNVLPTILSSCSSNLQEFTIRKHYLDSPLYGIPEFQPDVDSSLITCNLPSLRSVTLYRVSLEPFLPLLTNSQQLNHVTLARVDFTSVKAVQYDVTSIKDLEIRVYAGDTYSDEYSEENYAAMFDFLGKCSARTETMKINKQEVDYDHLLPGNYSIFKNVYAPQDD